jgi:indole-3-glycerol phosphate synthase
MSMSYAQEAVSPMRLAKALRRVYEDPLNPANPNHLEASNSDNKRSQQLQEMGMAESGLRRASFVVDIKRKSTLKHPRQTYCQFDDAGMVAEAMVRLGADAVFINTDYVVYGGDLTELESAVKAVKRANPSAAVVYKDFVVDEIQLGIAKQAGCDGIVLMSSVLGGSLGSFLDLATTIGLETIVECHTLNEVQHALDLMAPTILVNNYDRIRNELVPDQAIKLAVSNRVMSVDNARVRVCTRMHAEGTRFVSSCCIHTITVYPIWFLVSRILTLTIHLVYSPLRYTGPLSR